MRLFFLIFFLIANGTFAHAKEHELSACSAMVMTASSNPDPFELAVQKKDFRETLLSRKRSPTDIEFLVPEFQPVLVKMLLELQKFKKSQPDWTLNPIQIFRQRISFPRMISSLEKKIHRAFKDGITYWNTIELAFEFSAVADADLKASGNYFTDFYQSYSESAKQLNRLKNVIAYYPVILFPTFSDLSEAEINQIWGRGILPLGLIKEVAIADDVSDMAPRIFFAHDVAHAIAFIRAIQRLITGSKTDPIVQLSETEYKQANDFLTRHTARLIQFFELIENSNDLNITNRFEEGFFKADHENGFITEFLRYKRGASLEGVIYNPDPALAEFILKHFSE